MRFITKLKLLSCAVCISLLIVLILTACGEGDSDDANGTRENESVSTMTSESTVNIPTSRPISPTLPPSNPTLPPAATSQAVSETVTVGESGTIGVVNAINDLPLLDIFVDGESVERRLERYTAPRRGTQLALGMHELSVVESSGVGLDSSGVVYFEGTFEIEADEVLLFVLTGTSNSVSLSIFEEDLSPIEPGNARVMLVNALPDISDIRLIDAASVIIDSISFDAISNPVEITAGVRDFDIEETNGGFITDFEQELKSGFEYTLILVGDLSSDVVSLVVLERETPPQARVRITHAAPDVLPVDVVFDDIVVAENLSFGETLDFQTLPSKFYDVQIYDAATGATSPSLAVNRLNLREHESLDMVIFGQDNDLRVASHTIDTSPIPFGYSRLVVFHAAIGEENLHFLTSDEDEGELSVQYGAFSRELEMGVGTFEFRMGTGTGDEVRLVEAPASPITLEEGITYTYIVTGRSDEHPLFLAFDGQIQLVSQADENSLGGDGIRVSIRTINALVDDEAIRVELDDTQVTTRLAQYRISPPVAIENGRHFVRIYNASDVLVYEGETTLDDFQAFTLVVVGEIPNVVVNVLPDFSNIPSNIGHVRYVHAAPDLPQVVVYYRPVSGGQSLDPGVVVTLTEQEQDFLEDYEQRLSYTEVSSDIEIPEGLSEFTLRNGETLENIITFAPIDLVGGQIYDVLLIPSTDNGTELLVLGHSQD